jgi:phosphate uptake regulator
MLNDTLEAYFDGNQDLANAVIERDEEVDRLFFLIVRELRSVIQYPRMSEAMGITPVAALDLRLAAQYIERIADLAVDIAARTEKSLSGSTTKKMKAIAEQIQKMHAESVSNLFKFDSEKVAWVIAAEKEIIKKIGKIREEIISAPKGEPQAQLDVVDCLLRIGETAKDIADLALPTN